MVSFELRQDYWDTYPERLRALDVQGVTRAAVEHIHPRGLVWIVVGDWARMEKDVRALDLGPIELVDLDEGITSR